MDRRDFLKQIVLSSLLFLAPYRAEAWVGLLFRFLLRMGVRAGSKSAMKRFARNRLYYKGSERLFTRLGSSVRRHAKQQPRRRKLPASIRREVESETSHYQVLLKAGKLIIPQPAKVVHTGGHGEEFTIEVSNQSNSYQDYRIGIFIYDIDAKEVEGYVVGPIGILEPHKSVSVDLIMPSPLYPGRKALVTDMDGAQGRVSEIFYAI